MTTKLEVMVDLETLGTGADAVILSIGAVKFDPHNLDVPFDSFYVTVDPASCAAFGMKMDAKTVLWWMHPDRAQARDELLKGERIDLPTALDGFARWFGGGSLPTWGNGATFDNVILRNAYDKTGLTCPWQFWDDRCYRTLKNLVPAIKMDRRGTYHNALDDAISQAVHLQAIMSEIHGG